MRPVLGGVGGCLGLAKDDNRQVVVFDELASWVLGTLDAVVGCIRLILLNRVGTLLNFCDCSTGVAWVGWSGVDVMRRRHLVVSGWRRMVTRKSSI